MTKYFTKTDLALWLGSVLVITASFLAFDRVGYLTYASSLIGVTSLIFNAKGSPIGPLLMVIFSIIYGIISYGCRYYGEMLTYVGMTAPMALISLIAWLRHPFKGDRSQVQVNEISRREWVFMLLLTAAVTFVFYFILKFFNTANLLWSTLSVTTSFAAVYLSFRRSAYYALFYAANDVVLIVLWALVMQTDISYLSVMICFVVFFVNDLYGFVSWKRMRARQQRTG